MKAKAILGVALTLALLFCSVMPAVASSENSDPQLLTHYTFADANNIGKDSAGSQDLTVIGTTIGSTGTAKQVDGPNGLKALEFDKSYALISDAADVTDSLTEFTITYLVSANDAGELKSNVFSTGAGNGNHLKNSGINHLIDGRFAADGPGLPDFRLFGGNSEDSAQLAGNKWDVNQRKNDDGKNAKTFWKDRIGYDTAANTFTDACTYAANEWYRVVITVKLSDGTKLSEEQVSWPAGEPHYNGTGVQSMYMEKIGAIDDASDLVEATNYYSISLPYNLTSVRNDDYGLLIGAAYGVNKTSPTIDTNVRNYSMLIGKIADFRIYDKAMTQDQVVNLYKSDVPSTPEEDDGIDYDNLITEAPAGIELPQMDMLGAAVRGESDIRFGIELNVKDWGADLDAVEEVRYGTLFLPTETLGENELTLATADVLDVPTTKWQETLPGYEGRVLYTGVLTDIPSADEEITARGYMLYSVGGEWYVLYSAQISRSINGVYAAIEG